MRRHSLLVAIAVGMSVIPFSGPASRSASPPVLHLAASHALRFEANQGQFDSRVDFVARGGDSSISFTERGALISSANRSPFEIHLAGGRAVHPVGSSLSLTKTNYFIGNDSTRWRTDVPNFERVVYPSILDGVDLVFHGTNGRLEYDIVVAPNADPRLVAIDLDGRRGQLSDGNLVIATAGADVVQARPVAYQVDAAGTRLPVDAEFALEGGRVRFELGPYERSLPLVIDPILLSSTFEGGSGYDDGFQIAADATGVYVVGESSSPNFPVVGSLQSWAGDYDVVVTKLNPTGSAVTFATYIGGGNFDSPNAVAVDNNGAIYVGGKSNSFNFPVVAALQPANAGGLDGFVAKLSPSGNALVFSTYLGGSDTDVVSSMAVDAGGSIFVGGASLSTGLATAGVAQASFAGGTLDGFIAKLTPNATAVSYWTYLGGSGEDQILALAIDANGNALVTGNTSSTNLPTANAIQPTNGGGVYDSFATKLNPSGSAWVYSTYLGGGSVELGYGIVASQGAAFVAGASASTNFPTKSAIQSTNAGNYDVTLTKLDATGAMVFSTYLGGSLQDVAYGIALDAQGKIFIGGHTESSGFPVKDPSQSTLGGGPDGFVTSIAADGSSILGSTFLGGNNTDEVRGIALSPTGEAWVTGYTGSANFPLVGPIQNTLGGPNSYDMFITRLSFPPPIVVTPPNPVVPPRGSQTFVASGGSGAGYAFSLVTNASGGTLGATSGIYVAGPNGNTSDVFKVVDNGNASATVTVAVGPGVSVTPSTSNLVAGAPLSFTASGGSGVGFGFALTTSLSGGSITSDGKYKAGALAGTDVVSAKDSLGNEGTAVVTVTLAPPTPDAGSVDSGTSQDAGKTDAAVPIDASAGQAPPNDGGCSCTSTGAKSPRAWPLGALLLGLLLWVRRVGRVAAARRPT